MLRGGPFSEHDIDVLVRPEDVDKAVRAQDWLRKVYDGAVPVDLIFRPAELPVTDQMLVTADQLTVASVPAPGAPATDLLEQKLLSLGPHYYDFGWILPAARTLREQVDWPALRARTEHHPYAEAFLLLADRLGISAADASRDDAPGHQVSAGEQLR